MAFFDFRRRTQTACGGIIDIRSESIGVAIVTIAANGHPRIHYTKRIPMRETRGDTLDDSMKAVKDTLLSSLLALTNEGQAVLARAAHPCTLQSLLIICASPFSRTISRTISFERDQPFMVTAMLMNDLIAEAESMITAQLADERAAGRLGMVPTDRMTMNVKLNGYTAPAPAGNTAASVEFSHVTSFVMQDVRAATGAVLHSLLPQLPFTVRTYLFALYALLKDRDNAASSYWIADITGESTELAVVEDGALVASNFIPFGSNTLIRSLCEARSAPQADVRSQLRAYTDGTLSETAAAALQQSLAPFRSHLAEAARTLCDVQHVPATVIISAPGELQSPMVALIGDVLQQLCAAPLSVVDFESQIAAAIEDDGADAQLTVAAHLFASLQKT